jgi:hypothetical protein
MYHHLLRTVAEDRDRSRAAQERYLMLQALSESKRPEQVRRQSWLTTLRHAVRSLRRSPAPAPFEAESTGSAR